jgi:CO/xanthine dehydrogenase Mo-binding subunit
LACRRVRASLEERASARGLRTNAFAELLDVPIEALATYQHRATKALDDRGQGEAHAMFAFAAERAVVEVDRELGLVRVIQIAAAQDVGAALNPQNVFGQIEGGTAQGLGLALLEDIHLVGGRIANASFTDYLIPTILDMPDVQSRLIEQPEPGAPFGAKGVGEFSTIVSTAAVVAALRAATGRELHRVPVRPDDLVGISASPGSQLPPWPTAPAVPGPRPMFEYFQGNPDKRP